MRGRSNDNESLFVNLDTLGLRRSARIVKNPRRTPYGLMVLALASLSNGSHSAVNSSVAQACHCYQARVLEYEDFQDSNFDGSRNSTSPLAQIFQTTVSNNEVYNLTAT